MCRLAPTGPGWEAKVMGRLTGPEKVGGDNDVITKKAVTSAAMN